MQAWRRAQNSTFRAVVPFGSGEAEEAFFQDGVAAVPQREAKAHTRLPVAKAEQPVLAPAIGARPCVVMREIVPASPIRGIVLANRSPLALGQIRTEEPPVLADGALSLDALMLGGDRRRHA